MHEMLIGGALDVVTGDYLAELTMMILGRSRMKDPALGYAKTFVRQLEDCLAPARPRGEDRHERRWARTRRASPTVRELAARLGLTSRSLTSTVTTCPPAPTNWGWASR